MVADSVIDSKTVASVPAVAYKKIKEGTIQGKAFQVYAALDEFTEQPLSVQQWADATSQGSSNAFRLAEVIRGLPWTGVFFETPGVKPVNAARQDFQLCLLDGASLASFAEPRASFDDFSEHLQCLDDQYACQFPNLGGDATLIAPKKTGNLPNRSFSHLAVFNREAPETQVIQVWKKVADSYKTILQTREPNTPLWMSTAGQGVPWLHIRFDNFPKYYQYAPFSNQQ